MHTLAEYVDSVHTLAEDVDELIPPPSERPLVWGNALLSTTPTSMAIEDLAIRMVALENAVREIALEVQRLLDEHRRARSGSAILTRPFMRVQAAPPPRAGPGVDDRLREERCREPSWSPP